MKIFKEAYKILSKKESLFDFSAKNSFYYNIKEYSFKIYLKSFTWYTQCGCHVGVSNRPAALCKHAIAGIVAHFLKVNNLKLVENDRI